jgi:hypothetical protein
MSKPATTFDLAAFKRQLADSLERSAKSAGQTIVKESFTSEISADSQVLTAAIQRKELPTEKEIVSGVDLMYAYVSIEGQRELPAGYYRIRLALPGYEKSGDVKVSFIDSAGRTVHSLTGKGRPRSLKPGAGSNVATMRIRVSVCGNKKCFNLTRNGFFDWDWSCTDNSGNQVNCLDRQP